MEEQTKEHGFWQAVGLISFVFLSWVGLGFYASTQSDPGKFGDMFGSVNALFSGLAFAGLIYAIWLQRIELKLQCRELEATREELAGQKTQMEMQNQTLRKQNFEDTFFQLLQLHNDIVNAIDLVNPRRTIITKGRDCFSVFFSRLREVYKRHKGSQTETASDSLHTLNEIYPSFFA